jgi:hypothetical protein
MLLSARAPKLHAALRAAKRSKLAFVVLDGTLIPIDRVAADRPFYSGKHKCHGMNLQVIASPGGDIVWVSGALRGSTHDLRAARIWGIIRELAAAGLIVLADKGYHSAGPPLLTPYRGRGKPASQKEANKAHARSESPRTAGTDPDGSPPRTAGNDTHRSVDSCAGIQGRSDQSVTSGNFLPVVQGSPADCDVVRSGGSQRGSQQGAPGPGCLRAAPLPHRTDCCRSIRRRGGVKGRFVCTLTRQFDLCSLPCGCIGP